MKAVGILDTSILLELLNVPGRAHNAPQLAKELETRRGSGHSLLLPVSAILETGNHLGRIANGTERRRCAQKLGSLVRLALDGRAPFAPLGPLSRERIRGWFDEFVDWVTPAEHSLTDLSIKQAWDEQCELHPARRVYVWSLDEALRQYDRDSVL